MKERSILFSSEMVRAILEGRKTQTRRVIKFHVPKVIQAAEHRLLKTAYPLPKGGYVFWSSEDTPELRAFSDGHYANQVGTLCPYGQPGDRLWVRETWWIDEGDQPVVFYAATDKRSDIPLKPSIFMPRWASRILLEIVNIRVQRVQKISEEDAIAEGCVYEYPVTARTQYITLWDSLNAKRGYLWDSNPWVWVIEFKVVEVKK